MSEVERICGPLGFDPEWAVARAIEKVAEDSAALQGIMKEAAE
jgi:Ni,Fe-hydrogenase III large subunit